MKARPRSAERHIASLLTEVFVSMGYSPVERIPVLGRTGPDISINEFGLVVDVKSRIEVPISYLGGHFTDGEHYICPLLDIGSFTDPLPIKPSILVYRWFDHMHEWTLEKYKTGITAIIVHRPKLPYGKSALIISNKDIGEFQKRWKHQ